MFMLFNDCMNYNAALCCSFTKVVLLVVCAFRKAGWARRARVMQASLGRGATKDGSKITQEIKTWKLLDDEDLSKSDIQILYNGYAGEWFSSPIFGRSLSFRRRSGDNWIPSLTLVLLLTGLAGSSFWINFLVRKFQRRKRTNSYSPVEGASSVESNDVSETR